MTDKKQITEKYFLDTNILIYAINSNELEKHYLSIKFIKNNPFGNISTQSLRELANVLLLKTKLSQQEIKEKILAVGKDFPILPELPTDTITAINLCTSRQNFYDALLVSTMLRNNITTIVTENEKDFKEFIGIKVLNPFK